MKSTTEYQGLIQIENDTLYRDVKSKALLSTDKQALQKSRKQREQLYKRLDQDSENLSKLNQLNSDVQNLKQEINEVKLMLRALLEKQ